MGGFGGLTGDRAEIFLDTIFFMLQYDASLSTIEISTVQLANRTLTALNQRGEGRDCKHPSVPPVVTHKHIRLLAGQNILQVHVLGMIKHYHRRDVPNKSIRWYSSKEGYVYLEG